MNKQLFGLFLFTLGLLISTAGCQSPINLPTSTSTSLVSPSLVALPTQFLTPTQVTIPDEAIFIQQPASGSRVTSPVIVSGLAHPTFEQTLVIQLLLDDGTQVAQISSIIQADISQRGPFEDELDFVITGERQAFIQVFTVSPRDGAITHLSSVGIILSESGPEEIRYAESRIEQIHITNPSSGEVLTNGVVTVKGFAWAGFENTLLVELHDQYGNVIEQIPTIIESTEMGQAGPFHTQMQYAETEGPARIVVRDISPAFGGDSHLSSVEINLAP